MSAAQFQPTRPLRGATRFTAAQAGVNQISTHAPLAGRDDELLAVAKIVGLFQPTRPLRGATLGLQWGDIDFKTFQPTRPLRGATAKEYKSLCTFLR